MRTGNFFAMALILGLMLSTALIAAPTAYAQTLSSGSYQVQVHNSGTIHRAVWRLQVSGNQITGTSDWGTRVDPLQGYIESNRVIIQRDCRGQGFTGECRQVYNGGFRNGVIQGSFSGTGAAPYNFWTLYLGGSTPPSVGELQGTWKYSLGCGYGGWTGQLQINQSSDGRFTGTISGQDLSSPIEQGLQQGDQVTFLVPKGIFNKPMTWRGRIIRDGGKLTIQGDVPSDGCQGFTIFR
jgi:hypothetical protein